MDWKTYLQTMKERGISEETARNLGIGAINTAYRIFLKEKGLLDEAQPLVQKHLHAIATIPGGAEEIDGMKLSPYPFF